MKFNKTGTCLPRHILDVMCYVKILSNVLKAKLTIIRKLKDIYMYVSWRDIYISFNDMKNSPQYGFQIENKYQKVGSTGFLLL